MLQRLRRSANVEPASQDDPALHIVDEPDPETLAEELLAPEAEQRRRRAMLSLAFIGLALVLVIGASLVAYLIGGEELVRKFGYLGVFVSAIVGSASMFVPVPGALAGITVGVTVLDQVWLIPRPITIGVVVAAGSVVGELTGYTTGVGGRAAIIDSRIGLWLSRLMQRRGMIVVFLIGSLPNPFIDVAGIAAGVAGMPVKRFMAALFAGKLINYITVAWLVSLGIDWVTESPGVQEWLKGLVGR